MLILNHKLLKYSIVFKIPSSIPTFEDQPKRDFALDRLGFLFSGSSVGRLSLNSMLELELDNFFTKLAYSKT